MGSERRERIAQAAIAAWAIIGWAIVSAAAFLLLGRVASALTPFVLGGVIVLVFRSPVRTLEQRGMARSAAVAVCYAGALAVLAVVGAFFVPPLISQIEQFARNTPAYAQAVETWWTGMQGRVETVILPAWFADALGQVGTTIGDELAKWASALASGVITAGGAAAGLLFNLVLALVVGFWALKDLPKVRAEIMDLVSARKREEAEVVLETVMRVLGGYVRGQAMVSVTTGVLAVVGLTIAGVPYSLVLGLITGVFNIVPYIGPALAGIMAAAAGLFISPLTALFALLAVFAAQQLTDLFVTPRVMSEQVDLHPLLVIFSVLVGSTLFGFWGLLLGIPVAAIIKGLFVYYFEKHTLRTLGTENGALFRRKRCPEPGPDGAVTDDDCEPDATAESRHETTLEDHE